MTLIEAIKSGRPFRRRDDTGWTRTSSAGNFFVCAYSNDRMDNPSPDAIIAEDWEIQEPSVTITRTQFWEAFGPQIDCLPFTEIGGRKFIPAEYFPNLLVAARKFGLEEP